MIIQNDIQDLDATYKWIQIFFEAIDIELIDFTP